MGGEEREGTVRFARALQRPELVCAWRGSALLALAPDGRMDGPALGGFWFRQTRFLSALELEIGGRAPYACSVAEVSPAELELTWLHPEVDRGGGGGSGSGGDPAGGGLLFRNLDLAVRCRVRPASLEVRLRITSRWQDGLDVCVGWRLGADFLTVDEALFAQAADGRRGLARAAEGGVELACEGCGLPLAARVTLCGADARWEDGRLVADVRLARQRTRELTLAVRACDGADPVDAEGERRREARLAEWSRTRTRLFAAAETPLVEYAERAADDIGAAALLEGPEDEWLTPGAGVPLYQALWARDALTAAWQAGILDRGDVTRSVVATLTRLQGRVDDPTRDEQPGRILNQAKRDLLARTGRTGFERSYFDVASPFTYVISLGYHFVLTADRAHVAAHYDAAREVMAWAERDGDLSGRGWVEYLTRAPEGPTHQGWKDSENAVVDADGRQVEPPIAACEVQGYRYSALTYMAGLALALGRAREAARWAKEARSLKARFNRDFWMEDEGFLAFGLGPDGRQIRAVTSNAAQCLATGIVSREHIPRLVRRMFEPDLFSGWGVRTLSTANPAYNPLDYHLGSVWPVENASIVFGLRRYGLVERAEQLTRALYDLARLWPGGRTPECVGGYGRDEAAHPGAYPRANRPQTWNQSVWPLLVQCLLGLVPVAPLGVLLIDPVLPAWLPELTVRGLRVGDARVDLRFARGADGGSACEVLEREGTLRIVRQPWVESFSADRWDRLGGLVRSLSGRKR